jgi:hypothetical protein
VPFLTNGRFLTDPEQVERLYRPLCRIPSGPLKPASTGITTLVISEAPTAAEDAAGSAREVTMQLDIRFWGRGRLFWRLGVKAAAVARR